MEGFHPMKRIAIAAVAALTLAGSLAPTAASAQAYGQQQQHNDHNDRYDQNNRYNDRSNRDNDRNNRDHRRQRWEHSQHNGYYARGRFYYGPPSAAMQRRSDYRPAWQNWRRGERLPSYYRSHYRTVDYRSAHLRAPPRGYHYVRDDRGDLLLVAITTGIILSILANQ
jgi:Ni/Co efflux regulator RcnB